ncbi:MAG: Gfo/Idh/MocA family oxidoreductase, partial [Kiritimatiellae bacterium]|nr:Gfo/Idh/MocA family oxidoreductase [Kiritimatiellia bacterium]
MMRFTVLLAAVAAGTFRLSAETAVGVVGLDTSHAIAFTKMLNVTRDDPAFEGFRVTVAYTYGSLDIVSSTNRYPAYTAQMREMGVEILPSLDELLKRADVVLLETNDGRRHLEQAEAIFRAGKPVFIDKPIAASLADTVRIVRAGRKHQARYFSSSALRYVKNAQ